MWTLSYMLGTFDKQSFHRYISAFKVFCHIFLYEPVSLSALPLSWCVAEVLYFTHANKCSNAFCLAVYFGCEVVQRSISFYNKEFFGTLLRRGLKLFHS